MTKEDSSRVIEQHLSAEQLMRCCDRVWSADRRCDAVRERGPFRPGEIVYCKLDHVRGLFHALRRQRSRIVLVTSESDDLVTEDYARTRPPQVAAWFSTNAVAPDVHPLPLGLANSYCSVTLKATDLLSQGPREDGPLLYVNFRTESNPTVREPLMDHFRTFRGERWLTIDDGALSLEDYRERLLSHRFVLCPPGNGVDTHRMWEALYGGVVPVVMRHPALEFFSDLPILFVERFGDVTEVFLREAWTAFAESRGGGGKLGLGWWRQRIRSALGEHPGRLSLAAFVRARLQSVVVR